MACMALNILVGHTGLVSFGHGACRASAYAARCCSVSWYAARCFPIIGP
jgi:ABC-type branched-subunit amino acid transport system permease subunit